MSVTYTTRDGDTLSYICSKYYGGASGYVEKVLEANPGIAELGPVFDYGVVLTLPDVSTSTKKSNTVRLY